MRRKFQFQSFSLKFLLGLICFTAVITNSKDISAVPTIDSNELSTIPEEQGPNYPAPFYSNPDNWPWEYQCVFGWLEAECASWLPKAFTHCIVACLPERLREELAKCEKHVLLDHYIECFDEAVRRLIKCVSRCEAI